MSHANRLNIQTHRRHQTANQSTRQITPKLQARVHRTRVHPSDQVHKISRSLPPPSLASLDERQASVKSRLGKRLPSVSASDTTDNIKKSRSSRSSGTRDKSEENPDDSIVDPICPEVYIGNTTKPRIKGTRLTSTCLVSQCLAKGPEIYIDDTDDLTLPYYDFITVEDALADSTLSAGTRFDMTTNATSRINIQYGSWGTPESQIPDNCSENGQNATDGWNNQTTGPQLIGRAWLCSTWNTGMRAQSTGW